MLYVVTGFVSRISPYVKKFKKIKDNLWNFSCPSCGDMSNGKLKARGYIYRKGQNLNYICHRCQESSSFINFLKNHFPDLHKECMLDIFKSKSQESHYIPSEQTPIKSFTDHGIEIIKGTKDMIPVLDLDENHPAICFLKNRLIPQNKLKMFYYVDRFKHFINTLKPDQFNSVSLKIDGPRIILPFINENHKMFGLLGRSLGNDTPKYLTIKIDDESEKIYGMDRVDVNKQIFVVEGPIDSLFIDNCLAVAGSGFDTITVTNLKENCVIIPDNEPRARPLVRIVKKLIQKGFYVVMFPKNTRGKDINEMIQNGYSQASIMKMIHTNTFRGPAAMIRFVEWNLI